MVLKKLLLCDIINNILIPWILIACERKITVKQFVEVHYYVNDGKRTEFYNEIIKRGIADASRSEEGNEKYDYFFSPDNENELLLLEIWSSPEAVKLHGETSHFRELGDLKKEYVEDTVIRRYEIPEK